MKNKQLYLPLFLLIIVIGITLITLYIKNSRQIVTVQPLNSTTVIFDEQLKFKFENISENSKSKIEIFFNPEVKNLPSWSNDILTINHTLFEPGKNFEYIIFYNNSVIKRDTIYSKNSAQLSNEELIRYQQLAISEENNDKAKPWANSLPFESNKFLISYDYENNFIRVRIFADNKNLYDELKKEAVLKLAEFNVPNTTEVIFIQD